MSLRRFTIYLTFIYGISILSFSLLEVGHALMHTLKTSIHHHAHSHTHSLHDHDTIIPDDSGSDDVDSIRILNFFFLFFENYALTFVALYLNLLNFTDRDQKLISMGQVPFTPPPMFHLIYISA